MANQAKIRVRLNQDEAEVLLRIEHPMDMGIGIDEKTNQQIPAHFIQHVTFAHNGQIVAGIHTGSGVARDPLISIRIQPAKPGDQITVNWIDNQNQQGHVATTIEKN